jgi:hypothetical protein
VIAKGGYRIYLKIQRRIIQDRKFVSTKFYSGTIMATLIEVFLKLKDLVGQYRSPTFIGIGILLCAVCLVQAANQTSADSIVLRKKVLSLRLDSIELEKQASRRVGLDLTSLEAESRRLKDSIDRLRQAIADVLPAAAGTGLHRVEQGAAIPTVHWMGVFVPGTLFDWVIVVVGGIAVISGCILLVGLIRSFLRRPLPPRPKTPPQTPYAVPPPPFRQPPPIVQPLRDTSGITDYADNENDGIEALRKRIGADVGPKLRIKHPLGGPDEPNRTTRSSSKAADNVRLGIVNAARAGEDVNEIARKYYMSVDQVKLIVRVETGK